ncbi:nitroreductase family protein [Mycobacterium sp.]|uniref:nitroreductase family protein n=1 Tax=Mycobacterium sp. TaxID=1785 RepID=UPI003C7644F5
MNELLKLIEERHSARFPFDCSRVIAQEDLLQILEAARWSPTAHNMQNFEIVIVDDRKLLDEIGTIPVPLSEEFLQEHWQLLSFSEEELRRKGFGLLAGMLPPWMRDPARKDEVGERIWLQHLIPACPVLMIALHDATKRAPASQGDVLGMMSLGCVLQNMWLMAQSLGLGFQVLSVLSGPPVEQAVQKLLAVPGCMKVGFAVRLGHPATSVPYPRVRREVAEFAHWNHFGGKPTGAEVPSI